MSADVVIATTGRKTREQISELQAVLPFYFGNAPNTSFGLDAKRALLRLDRNAAVAIELELGAVS